MHIPNLLTRAIPAALVLATLAGTASAADTIFVRSDADPGGDGSSWEQAFTSLDEALAVAEFDNEIWVAGGFYAPDPGLGRDGTFLIPDGVRVYGGFVGEERDLEERPEDVFDNPSVLSGADSDNYSVITINDAGRDTLLNGFVIEGGAADAPNGSPFYQMDGGGIFGVNASPTLQLLIFQDNVAGRRGAGIALTSNGTEPIAIEACDFDGNAALQGGGVSIDGAAIIGECRFTQNTAEFQGAALYFRGDDASQIIDCRITGNTAGTPVDNGFGGGVYAFLDFGGSMSIEECRIQGNTGTRGGGGLYLDGTGSSYTVSQSQILGNDASGGVGTPGGGVLTSVGLGTVTFDSCLVAGNTSVNSGAAFSLGGTGDVSVINCTVVGNVTGSICGGIRTVGPDTVVENTIVFNNQNNASFGRRSRSIVINTSGTTVVRNSLVEFWNDGEGPLPGSTNVIDADPMFVDADGNDDTFGTLDDNVRLQPGSPAIDAGTNTVSAPVGNRDVYRSARFLDDTGTPDTGVGPAPVVDIGAAEFQGTTPGECVADTNGDGMLSPADFNGWILAFNNQSPACDQNGDGNCTPADFNGWILNFNTGC